MKSIFFVLLVLLIVSCSDTNSSTTATDNTAENTTNSSTDGHQAPSAAATTENPPTTEQATTSDPRPSDEDMAFFCKDLNNKIAVGAWNTTEAKVIKDGLGSLAPATFKGKALEAAEIRITPLNRKDPSKTAIITELMLEVKDKSNDPLEYIFKLKQIFHDQGDCACVQVAKVQTEDRSKGMHLLEHTYYYKNGKLAGIYDAKDSPVEITDALRSISEENIAQFDAIKGL